jgi:alanine-synthesizing transaminase
MFSTRLDWDLRPNRLSEILREKRRMGAALLDLTESNPTRAGISYRAEEILRALGDPRSLVYQPQPAGAEEARQAVAAYYSARGVPVGPERILLTASTSEAYAYLFKLLAGAGDEVLVPRPSYPLFEFLAALECVRVAAYPLGYDHGWALDIAALARAFTPRTRAVILVNPNNPTGSFLKQDERDALVALCAERQVALISDEVFADYPLRADPTRVATLARTEEVLTFCLSGLSKVAALPQLKLGWIVIGGPAGARAAAAGRLELIADTYLSVNTPVQHAAPRLLAGAAGAQAQIRSRTAANLDQLRAAIGSESACRILDLEGGWYATLQVPRIRTEEEWCTQLLLADDVVVQPGFFYDFEKEAFLVVSLLPEPAVFREGVARLLARIHQPV